LPFCNLQMVGVCQIILAATIRYAIPFASMRLGLREIL